VSEIRHLRLIGLYSPAAQSGKSTVASILTTMGYEAMGFAQPLKAMTESLLRHLGYHDETVRARMLYGDLKEVEITGLGKSTRDLMRTLGTEWGRGLVHDSLWTDIAMARVNRCPKPVVIDDMRFANEMAAIRAAGGVCIRITRPGIERGTSHASEGALDGEVFDAEIVNDGSLATLQAKVRRALEAAKASRYFRQVEVDS
jgi:hypothetical protein